MRTPTLAWWSSGRARGVSHQVGTHLDLLPSLAELAEAELPASLQLDGLSLAALLRGRLDLRLERPVFFYRGNTLYAARWEQYKVENLLPPSPPPLSSLHLPGSFLDLDDSSGGAEERDRPLSRGLGGERHHH